MNSPLRFQKGLTLIELMVAITLGLLLAAGIGTLFVATHKSNRQNDLLAGMQDQARFALTTLSRDITMAGYWGGVPAASAITTTGASADAGLTANDCGATSSTKWAMVVLGGIAPKTYPNRVEFRNQDNTTAVSGMWSCIGHYVSGTDIVALRRVAGQEGASINSATDTTSKLVTNYFYLKTNSVVGTLIRWGASSNSTEAPLSPPTTYYKYVPRIYFVRDFSHTVGDGIPTLCRKELCPTGFTANADSELSTCGGTGTTAGMYSECLAEGVEDMQIVWGIGTTPGNAAAGIIDRYTSRPTAQEVASQAFSAQIALRMRTSDKDASYKDTKTYNSIDPNVAAFTPSGAPAVNYYRRQYSTTVNLRNPAN